MLSAVIIKNFFSFKEETRIELNTGVNILLGINGSGKTSFINALRLLFEGITGDGVEKLLQTQWGGFGQIINCTGKDKGNNIQLTFIFDNYEVNKFNHSANFHSSVYYRITINPLGSTDYFLDEKLWTEHSQDSNKSFVYLDFHNGQGHLSKKTQKFGVDFQNYTNGDISSHELVLRQINDPNQYLPIHTIRKSIESISVYNSFDTGESSSLRRITEFSTGERLWKDGKNLTQILNNLKNNHSLDFEKIENELNKVNPVYKNIEISNIAGQAYLSLREKNLDKTIGALHISDGTLRFLLLESIFLNSARGNLVAIDEPERGLHPDMIRSVADMIKFAVSECQIILATHSPYLLNQFSLDDILVFEKNELNSTIIRKVSEDDYSAYDDELLPGQLWLKGELGGKRW